MSATSLSVYSIFASKGPLTNATNVYVVVLYVNEL